LAEALEVSRQAVSEWLKGKRQPTGAQALALQAFLMHQQGFTHLSDHVQGKRLVRRWLAKVQPAPGGVKWSVEFERPSKTNP
jgi:transcriptional regulator with XRE-family HTH domain